MEGGEIQSGTIESYISEIKAILKSEGIELNTDRSQLTALIQASKSLNDKLFIRMPIHRKLLVMILDKMGSRLLNAGQPYLAKLYKAIAVSGYFGMLRTGEMMTGTHPIFGDDVLVSEP